MHARMNLLLLRRVIFELPSVDEFARIGLVIVRRLMHILDSIVFVTVSRT